MSNGTYVEFPMTQKSEETLKAFVEAMGLEPAPSNYHVTTVYSRVPIEYEPCGLEVLDATPMGYILLQGNNGLGICLALLVQQPEFRRSWEHARWLGATWDYSEFVPHVSLAYGLTAEQIVNKCLYVPPFKLQFGAEVVKELDPNWRPETQEAE